MSHRLCLLLIDDNPADLLLAQEAFAEHEEWVSVSTCRDGESALKHLRDPGRTLPDVVILDINMPQMNGFEVLRAIRADTELRHLPVVMLTTSDSSQDIDQAYDLFASSYMVKRGQFAAFVEQVDQFVQFWRDCRFKQSRVPRLS
ncbi:response regulator [Deinococcus sp. HMF7604]|uniref:response regulator n=1 Tax=Deinococcus betulae TaxID=2873312 RepID=UPI001CCC199A|nr:response regulator [Deinococcus betulae]MBZ9749669.1 response regulator [Deinococcus betulae]